ncbi:DNA polymerase II [Pseudoalteromonas sp. MMG022]|uniref:DNA polymerase II n=1 Tax=Pseudoalteromonas sp. MMG022 TaxID=2909978 RepID=UPI001F006513|nr:DNA polymerase II [Pseudoalteromonas sp. MMG022]MCF6436260.1 DNA polymerase II [Pseudoalteromonas sp. MMG022]
MYIITVSKGYFRWGTDLAQAVYAGFILSRQQINHHGRLQLCYWLKTDQGTIKAYVDNEQPVFFIRYSDQPQAQRLLKQESIETSFKNVGLKHFDQEEMIACYCQNTRSYHQAKQALDGVVNMYEEDIRHCDRFLMERFIRGGIWVQGNSVAKTGYMELTSAKLKAHRSYRPTLSVLSLDIECSGDGVLFSIGLASENHRCVIMIGEPPEGQDTPAYIHWVPDESALLFALMEKISVLDPDVIIGWNVIEFDFVVLAERAQMLGIELILGKDAQPIDVYKGNYVRVMISGRVVIDGIDTLKNATYHFDSFRLSNVAEKVLGEKKLIEQDDRLEEIIRQFNEDKLNLAAYNLKDCELVLAIFAKLNLLDFAIVRSQLTGLELERMGGSVAAFTNLYLPLLHRSGYVAPNLGEHGLNFESPGGYVMDSKPGLYKNVAVLDFKSLYPSIIRTFCIDPMGLIEGLKSPQDAVPGFHNGSFSRTRHHLPTLVAELAQARQSAKQARDDMLSQAIKIIMNSLYGVLGSKGCRFYDPRLASSITLRGHEIMQTTQELIEEQGLEVIYGDTDSTFVKLPDEWGITKCEAEAVALVNIVNTFWQQECSASFDLTSHLEIEFETLYHTFFMPTIRGQAVGSKKRYVGEIIDNGRAKLVFKGMESVRSDWTEIAKKYQQDVIRALFDGECLLRITKGYVNSIRSGEVDRMLRYSKRLGRALEEYTKTVPPHVKAARLSVLNNQSRNLSKGSVINYYMTNNGPVMHLENNKIDYEHYIEKQIYPILMMIPDYENVLFQLTGQRFFSF